jgi:flavin-dependent dehydrogenase
VTREVLDAWLVEQAVAAGATLVDGAAVLGPDLAPDGIVAGVRVRSRGGSTATVRATMTIGADGRRSTVGRACGLSACARRPRRWAIGAYFDGVEGLSTLGEMHVRRGHYIGVAPTADGRANACLVQPHASGDAAWADPGALLRARLRADPLLGPRFARAAATTRATVLGPLAIETRVPGCAGLLLVGDAAGFVDPMTGDGIRLALASAEIAADATREVLAGRMASAVAHRAYARALESRVGWKRSFNRAMRSLVGSPPSVGLAARGAILWPAAFRAAIRYAGDAFPGGAY